MGTSTRIDWDGSPIEVVFVMVDKSKYPIGVGQQPVLPYGNKYYIEQAVCLAGKKWLGVRAWFYTWGAREFKYRRLKDKIICFVK